MSNGRSWFWNNFIPEITSANVNSNLFILLIISQQMPHPIKPTMYPCYSFDQVNRMINLSFDHTNIAYLPLSKILWCFVYFSVGDGGHRRERFRVVRTTGCAENYQLAISLLRDGKFFWEIWWKPMDGVSVGLHADILEVLPVEFYAVQNLSSTLKNNWY